MSDLLGVFQNVATVLVESTGFGRPITYTAVPAPTVDKVAGSSTPGSPVPHTLTGVIREYTLREIAQSGGTIQAGDVEVMLAEPGFTAAVGRSPDPRDSITDGGVTYRIVSPIRPVPAGTGNAMWQLHARRVS